MLGQTEAPLCKELQDLKAALTEIDEKAQENKEKEAEVAREKENKGDKKTKRESHVLGQNISESEGL